jgi:nucleoside-diphosphate-sugar epimerase
MTTRVMVTGAGGFVGGFLARYLAATGYSVTAITRGRPDNTEPNLDWQTLDLETAPELPFEFDVLVHCAAVIPARCPEPEILYRGNITMARRLFDLATKIRAQTIIYMSSVSVYGAIDVPVVTEDLPPGECDAYGKAKRDVEELLENAVRLGVGSGLAIRLPGTVGRGSHDNFLSATLTRILAGGTVLAHNPDSLFNNIVYVGNLAEFVAEWIAQPRPGYAVTNLGASEPLNVRDVLCRLVQCLGHPVDVNFQPGGKPPFLISIDRAQSLGYRPATVAASIAAFANSAKIQPENLAPARQHHATPS